MIVSLSELVEALNRTTKMKRAPAGARSSNLKTGAFVPELTGFRVEMPGGSSLVNIKTGNLSEEVVFAAKAITPIAKVLSTYLGQVDDVTVRVSRQSIEFQCGGSRLKLARKS